MKSRGWASLLLAAVVGLFGQPVDAAYTRIDTGLPAIQSSLLQAPTPAVAEIPAGAWIVESIIPLGTSADGQPLALISLLVPLSSLDELTPTSTRAGPCAAPKTHTRVFCIVQPPLGLAPFSYKYGGGDEDFNVETFVPAFAPKPEPYVPPAFVNPGPGPNVYRKEPVLARYHSYEWVGPAGRFYSAKDVPGYALFKTDTPDPESGSFVDVQRYKTSLARELRTGDASQYESNLGMYYMANALLLLEGGYSLKAGLATRPAVSPAFTGKEAWASFRSAYKGQGLSVTKGSYFSFSQGYAYMKESPLKYEIWKYAVNTRPTVNVGYGFVEKTATSSMLTALNRGYGSGVIQFTGEFIWGWKGPLGPGDSLLYGTRLGRLGYAAGAAWAAYEVDGWMISFDDKK